MTSGRILVKLMTAAFSVLDPFIKYSDYIINGSTIDDNQIFDKKSVRRIPSTMQHSACRIEQILDLFVIDLCERCFDREFFILLLGVFPFVNDNVPKILYCSRYDAVCFVGLEYLLLVVFLLTCHCVCFSAACLAVCKNCDRVTVQCRFNIVLN